MLQWTVDHLDELVVIAGLILAAASAITKLTPTPKDDAVVAKLIGYLSFLQPKRAGLLKIPFTKVKKHKQ